MSRTAPAHTPTRPGDLVGFDGLLSTEERDVRDTVKAFVGDHISPYIGDWYDTATFPLDLIKEFGRLGVLGMHLKGYGDAGTNSVAYRLACMELEAADTCREPCTNRVPDSALRPYALASGKR